ncbi:Trafficking protein particle complex subunit 3 [Lemmus lemmus]
MLEDVMTFGKLRMSLLRWHSRCTCASLQISQIGARLAMNSPSSWKITHWNFPIATHPFFYLNLLCGVLWGVLEVAQMAVESKFVQETLKEDGVTEIRMGSSGRLETISRLEKNKQL